MSSQLCADTKPLGGPPPPGPRPVLVLVCGLPGSGKTTFTRQLAERVELNVVESDALRRSLFPRPTHRAPENHRLFGALHTLVEETLQARRSAVVDATNLAEQHRATYYATTERSGAALLIVWVEAPPSVIEARLRPAARRGHSDAGLDVYLRMRRTAGRPQRPHTMIDTTGDTRPSVDAVAADIRRAASLPQEERP